ncbi:MAG: hypothetical protein ACK4PM_14425 [Acinetobacter junii]
MLKTILTLGTGVALALGCYYKSHKDKLSDKKKDDESTLESDVKGKNVMSKILK